MKIVVFISTNGGVLSQLLKVPYFHAQVSEVISDRECGGLEVARQAGVKATLLPAGSGDEFSENVLRHLDVRSVDLFVSFYTRIFNKRFVAAARHRIINLHPSILPACPGKDGFGDTVKSGSMFIGSTIHLVDEGIDTGAPVIQSAVPFDRAASREEMRHAVFVDQCRTLLQAVKWFEEKRVVMDGAAPRIEQAHYGPGIYSPKLDFEAARAFDVPLPKGGQAAEPASPSIDHPDIIDLRASTNHPLSLPYCEIYSNCLLDGKLEHGRSQPGFGLTGKTPFVAVAKTAIAFGIEKAGVLEAMEAVLAEYYELVRPASAAEWLGVTVEAGHRFNRTPPWGSVFPWRARSVESYQHAYEKAALAENSAGGARLDITKGWLFCGPVSKEKCRVEAMRIHYVLREISRNGYQRSNAAEGDVKATALLEETGDWRWLITAGNHRASAAAALGFAKIPIRVNLVISRQHVKLWPHVVDGLYSEANALRVFDNFFAAVTPPVMKKWMNGNEAAV